MTLRIEPVTGAALQRALPALAKLRIEVFREWPYLYEGSLEYEANYIERFARLARGVIVVATDAGEAVGAATAAPMEGQNPDVTAPFVERGYDLKKLFYFGEFGAQAGLSWARHRACLLRSARSRGARDARRRARDLLGRRALARRSAPRPEHIARSTASGESAAMPRSRGLWVTTPGPISAIRSRRESRCSFG